MNDEFERNCVALRFYDSVRLYHQLSVLVHFNKVHEKPFGLIINVLCCI